MSFLYDFFVELSPVYAVLLKITLVVALGWVLHFMLLRSNPRWRVLVWRLSLLGVVLIPVLEPFKYLEVSVAPHVETVVVEKPFTIRPSSFVVPYERFDAASDYVEAQPARIPQDPSFSIFAWVKQNYRSLLLGVWVVGVVLLAFWEVFLWLGLRQKMRLVRPAPEALQEHLDRVARRLNYGQSIRLQYCEDFSSPFVTGLFKPALILPGRLIKENYRNELPAIFAHEIVHLQSRDIVWLNLFRIIGHFLWFHPLVWKIRGVHCSACEEVCDGVGANYVGSTESYSGTLARVALGVVEKIPAFGGIPMVRSAKIVARLRLLKQRITSVRLSRRKIVLSGFVSFIALAVIGGLSLVYAESNTDKTDTRVIHFPRDRSLGVVSVGELRTHDPLWWQGWKVIGQAKGDIQVPIGQAVRLEVSNEAIEDISPLGALGPDDIQALALNTNFNNFDDAGLIHLAGLTGLKLLALSGTQVKGPGLVHIKELASLESLSLSYNCGDESLVHISGLNSLVRLVLFNTKITDAGLFHLRHMDNLAYLSLEYCKISGEGFSSLVGNKSLRTLVLSYSDVNDDGLKAIAKIKSIENLYLDNTPITDVGLQYIAEMKNLKELTLISNMNTPLPEIGPRISDASLEAIARLTRLESLKLPVGMTDVGLSKLKDLSQLRELKIESVELTGFGLEFFKKIKIIEVVNPSKWTPGSGFSGSERFDFFGRVDDTELSRHQPMFD